MFDTIAVDLGGVAARFRPAGRLEALVAATGFPPEKVDERIFGSGLENRLERGEVRSPEAALALLLSVLDDRLDSSALVDAWSRAFEPVVEVLATLAALPERVALFTNNGPLVDMCLEEPLRSIRTVCDVVVCSWHLRAVKPERAAFERFSETIGAPAQALLLVDDSPANVKAAQEAGWAAGQVTCAAELVAVINENR